MHLLNQAVAKGVDAQRKARAGGGLLVRKGRGHGVGPSPGHVLLA